MLLSSLRHVPKHPEDCISADVVRDVAAARGQPLVDPPPELRHERVGRRRAQPLRPRNARALQPLRPSFVSVPLVH